MESSSMIVAICGMGVQGMLVITLSMALVPLARSIGLAEATGIITPQLYEYKSVELSLYADGILKASYMR